MQFLISSVVRCSISNEGRYRSVLCKKRPGEKTPVAPAEVFLLHKKFIGVRRANTRFSGRRVTRR